MTDKHYVDANKLLEWAKVGLGSAKLYTKLEGEIESGRIDPDPPQQPDTQVESLIQQKDAEILRMYGVNQILETELFEAKAEIDKLKQSKRFVLIRKIREKADKDTYALAEECVRLEGELKTANLAYEGLQTNCVSRGEYEATLKKLDDMTKAYHALLQDEGEKP